MVVVPRPGRAADPLQVPRRADGRIVGHRVVAGVVQVVGPLVDLRAGAASPVSSSRPRLHVGHAAGRQHPQHFLSSTRSPGPRRRAGSRGCRCRAAAGRSRIGRDPAVQARAADVCRAASTCWASAIQALDQVGAWPARRPSAAVAAAQVDDQPARTPVASRICRASGVSAAAGQVGKARR